MMNRIAALFLMSLPVFLLCMCSSKQGGSAGLVNGRLKGCPASPNCVSTSAEDSDHYIAPLTYTGSREDALMRLRETLGEMKRVTIITESAGYIHCEFRSALFRFVDDVEFLLPEGVKEIHVRSASRKGYSDMGVNRKRVEDIRRVFNAGTD